MVRTKTLLLSNPEFIFRHTKVTFDLPHFLGLCKTSHRIELGIIKPSTKPLNPMFIHKHRLEESCEDICTQDRHVVVRCDMVPSSTSKRPVQLFVGGIVRSLKSATAVNNSPFLVILDASNKTLDACNIYHFESACFWVEWHAHGISGINLTLTDPSQDERWYIVESQLRCGWQTYNKDVLHPSEEWTNFKFWCHPPVVCVNIH